MYFAIPKDKAELIKIYEPYMDGVKLSDDAPEHAQKAHDEVMKWFAEMLENEQ